MYEIGWFIPNSIDHVFSQNIRAIAMSFGIAKMRLDSSFVILIIAIHHRNNGNGWSLAFSRWIIKFTFGCGIVLGYESATCQFTRSSNHLVRFRSLLDVAHGLMM